MSKKKRPKSDDNSSDAQHEKRKPPGKTKRHDRVDRKPEEEAASTDMPGTVSGSSAEVGPEDFEARAPAKLRIIDIAFTPDRKTQLAVARGSNHGVTMDDHASVTDINGKLIAEAKIVRVGEGTTFLTTNATMDKLGKAFVQID